MIKFILLYVWYVYIILLNFVIEMSVCEIRWDVFDLWIFFFLEKNLNLNKKDVNLKFKKFFLC